MLSTEPGAGHFDLRNNEVEGILHGDFVELDLNNLDALERTKLSEIANENGLWGDLSAKSNRVKAEFIRQNCGNEFRSFILHMFEEPSLRERIRSTFYAGTDDETLNCIAVVLFLDVANFDPDLFLITQLSGIDFARAARLKKDATSREYVDFLSGKVRVKSSILGQFILKDIFDYDASLKYLIKAIERCEAARGQNSYFHEIQKELMKFSFIDKIFARTRNTDHYVRFYDSLKTLYSMRRNPQFWLQYAIARLEHSDFKSAHTLFRTAYSHAQSIPNYKTFQIDNHYARYLLVSRTRDSSYNDYFKAFIDAHNLLVKQARTERGAYYPFKVARSYSDFVVQNYDRLIPEQRAVISKAVNQMIELIDRSSTDLMGYPVVREARGDLVEADKLLSG